MDPDYKFILCMMALPMIFMAVMAMIDPSLLK